LGSSVSWRVPSLALEPAVELFVDRAALVRPGFVPHDNDKACIARICERLDGLPLAIELAAARIRMMSPSAIAAGLEDRFRLLTGGGRTAQPRQQTLEASVAWSHDLLDEAERTLLRRLSVFAGGFTLEAAEAVCAGGTVDSYAVLDLLTRLVDKSLVQAGDGGQEGRFRLLETIRHYARDRLVQSGEADGSRDTHLRWFLDYALRAEPELGAADAEVWMTRLDVEHDNLQAALEWADATGAHESLLLLAAALSLFWEARGHRHQGIGGRWFARALAVDDGPSVARARALWAAAHMGIYGGDIATTIERTPQALSVAETVGDQRTVARANITINYARAMFDPPAGLAGLAESIEMARVVGDDWGVADGLKMMTLAWGARGDYDGILGAASEMAQVAQKLGNKLFMAWPHAAVAYVALRRGDAVTARTQLELSVALCEEIRHHITRWLAICWLGEVDAFTGNHASARDRYEQILHQGAASEGELARHSAIPDLGALMLALGDVAGARRVIEPAVPDFEDEVALTRVPFLLVRGEMLLASGDDVGARSEFDKAKQAAAQLGNEPFTAQTDACLGRLARRQGDVGEAEDLYHRSLALSHRHRLVPGIVESIEALAGIATDQESATEAVRLFAAAAAMRSSIGMARRPADQTGYEDDLYRAKQLDPDGFALAWDEGQGLTADEVVAYASRARGERKRPSSGWASLTPTELEVVKLTAKGFSNPEIAERLFIARATVKTHLTHIFTKLGITSRAALASEATRRGL
jgi:DNA-binding CsgD family transcriptional regulator/tetratricopeptide (TPR) repeat protein